MLKWSIFVLKIGYKMHKVILKKNEERRIKNGHLWVFSNEVDRLESDDENIKNIDLKIDSGELVQVFDSKNNFIGSGFYNPHSLITVRMIESSTEIDLNNLLKDRIIKAASLRKSIYPKRESYRLAFSESDYLPGLIIDKYNDTYVMQIYSSGMQKNIDVVVDVLKNEFAAKNIFTKNESYFRKMEGLPEEDSVYLGEMKDEIIDDGEVKYKVEFSSGQKTGFYFDQCDNREYFGKYCKEKSVLDCFCNSGGFGLHASLNGATSITFVDSSQREIESAKYNFGLNGFSNQNDFVNMDVFDYLQQCIDQNKKFDIINVDPPAFAKNKKTLATAIKGYEKLNRLALQLLNTGGFLFTSSCSFHLKEDEFIGLLQSSANKASKKIQLVYFNNAALDHPSLPAMPETTYLKFALLRAL